MKTETKSERLARWLFGQDDGCGAVVLFIVCAIFLVTAVLMFFNDRGMPDPKIDATTEPEYVCGSSDGLAVVAGDHVLAFKKPETGESAILLVKGTAILVEETRKVENRVDGRFKDYEQTISWVRVRVPQLGNSLWVKEDDLEVGVMECVLR